MILNQFLQSFFNLVFAMAPALLLGIFLSGFLHKFLSQNVFDRMIKGKGLFPVIKAAILGIPLPLCSCSVIPTARLLREKGASKAATSSFLISTPETGIDSILVTYNLMGWQMTIIRPIAAFLSATVAGMGQLLFNVDEKYSTDNKNEKSCCHNENCHAEPVKISFADKFLDGMKYSLNEIMDDISPWLLLGIVISAGLNVIYDPSWNILNSSYSRYIMLLIGIPLYICASATTPIAATLISNGLSAGSALVLLMTGPATNLTNLLVMQKVIGKRGVLINVFSISTVAIILSYLVDSLHLNFALLASFDNGMSEHYSDSDKIFGLILLILIGRGFYRSKLSKLFKSKSKGSCCS